MTAQSDPININPPDQSEIGMIGLGVMGRNFLLNMADHGFSVAGYDRDKEKTEALQKESAGRNIQTAVTVEDFMASLRTPRAIILLVPAGAPVDSVIDDLKKHLDKGDLVIDAGNSYFKDTDVRIRKMAGQGVQFMGMGISGGEEGARNGPSLMPGGLKESFERVRPVFEAAAAKYNGAPCVTYLGSGSAGHFVKMVHNGIEYAMMQLIAETYDILKRSLNFKEDKLHQVFDEWNKGELSSYLLEITSIIFSKIDEITGKSLIDVILDVARQKGTGMWTSQSAMELQVPTPTIDMAVGLRDLSVFEKQRDTASALLQRPVKQFNGDKDIFLDKLSKAFYSAMIITYSQGMALLLVASEKYCYRLNLESVARIWRGGCIIRAALLDEIVTAFHNKPELPNLLLDPQLSQIVMQNQEQLRYLVSLAAESGVPVPAYMASLSYLDSYRSAWLPANLIQAQRDFFGAHTYERIDSKGTFHTEWQKE